MKIQARTFAVSLTLSFLISIHIAVDGWAGDSGPTTSNRVQLQSIEGVPDLTVWGPSASPRTETRTFSPLSCAVVEGMVQSGTRKLLRFTTETRNQGTGDIYLGNPATNPKFVYAPCHGHYHLNNYAQYRLLDGNGQQVAIGQKVGFCLLDTVRWSADAPSTAKYTCSDQGIQAGWGDVYDASLDGQWIDITGVPDGNYTLELEVNPGRGLNESNYDNNITRVLVTIGDAPPVNDNFVDAMGLSGSSASLSGLNVNATKEAGEPDHAGDAGGHSVWYRWTAPSATPVTIDTIGSGFDTLLGVYTGNSVSNLTPIASNDDIATSIKQSRLGFTPVAGTTYQIAVDGYAGASGMVVLTLNQKPVNDNFAQCEFIGGASGSKSGSNVGATKETGEPNHAGNPGGASIWYCWTAPKTERMEFDTIGSTFDTVLAVYMGNSVDNLLAIGSNNDITSTDRQSQVTFDVVAATQYHIVIDGFNGDSGNTWLNWNPASNLPFQSFLSGFPLAKSFAGTSAPLALSGNFLAFGEYELAISGQPMHRYTVEVSDDLLRWTSLATSLADRDGRAYFRDKATLGMRHDIADSLAAGGWTPSGVYDPVCRVTRASDGEDGLPRSRFYRVKEATWRTAEEQR